jgi:hypothetical protein
MRLLVFCALAFGGCGPSAWSEPLQPGTYSVACKKTRSACYREAARLCPAGFDVVDSGDHTSTSPIVQYQNGQMVQTGSVQHHRSEMLIRCKGAP